MALTRNGVPLTSAEQATMRAGIGGSVSQVSYSTVIPLDGDKVMPRTQISGAVALTIGTLMAGGSCRIPFLGNGTNVPTIAGASEWATSFGYDNSQSGLLNVLDVWSDDGTYAYFAWSQPVTNSGADTTPPTITGNAVANATPTVVTVTFSEAMNTSAAPVASAFTVSGHTVSSVAFASSTTLSVTVTPAFVNGEAARTLAYTQPGTNNLRDVAGNLLATVSGVAITNNVQPADTTPPTLSSAAVNGASLVMTYNEALNTTAPATSAYSVVGAGGTTQAPSAVNISGSNVVLTLGTPAVSGNTVTISYTVPGTNPVRDMAGNSAAALSGQAVTNSTGADDYADWLTRLSAAGGDASTTEKDAVQAFINTAKTGATPFWDCITRANVFVNNANGSLVPFKIQSGSTNDTSPGATDVNAGGRGNTTGTGYVNTQTPPPAAAGGLSVYLRDTQSFAPAAANALIGARDTGNTQVFRIVANIKADGTAQAGYLSGAWGGASNAQMESNTGAAMRVGHWHVQRNSSASLKLRRNGSLVGTEFVTATTAVPVSENIYVFAQNGGGTAGAFTKAPTSIGYYAILSGAMTDAQAAAYNTAVVAMMTAMSRNL